MGATARKYTLILLVALDILSKVVEVLKQHLPV